MAQVDPTTRTLALKFVYYGPSGVGKTASLRQLDHRLRSQSRCRLLCLDTQDEAGRTLYFDTLPIEVRAGDSRLVLRLYSVPGEPMLRHTRRLLLRGADGVVLLSPAQNGDHTEGDAAAVSELRHDLRECGINLDAMPLVMQSSPSKNGPATGDGEVADALLHLLEAARPGLQASAEAAGLSDSDFSALLSETRRLVAA